MSEHQEDFVDRRTPGELFRDPAARVVWAAICALDEASQHDVLAELRDRLADFDDRPDGMPKRAARAVSALRAVSQMLGGRSPSVAEYRQLRNENPDLEWPADGTVRRALGGSWNGALARAHLDSVPEPLATTPALGPRYSKEELVQGIRACAQEIGQAPTYSDYISWARQPDVRKRPGRRASSQAPFQRAFGGWREALVAADLNPSDRRELPTIRGRGYGYTKEDCFRALDQVRTRLNGFFPSPGRYSAERNKILDEHEATGEAERAMPTEGNDCPPFRELGRHSS